MKGISELTAGTTGDITVVGTLTNVYKEESKQGADDGITGKINAAP